MLCMSKQLQRIHLGRACLGVTKQRRASRDQHVLSRLQGGGHTPQAERPLKALVYLAIRLGGAIGGVLLGRGGGKVCEPLHIRSAPSKLHLLYLKG